MDGRSSHERSLRRVETLRGGRPLRRRHPEEQAPDDRLDAPGHDLRRANGAKLLRKATVRPSGSPNQAWATAPLGCDRPAAPSRRRGPRRRSTQPATSA